MLSIKNYFQHTAPSVKKIGLALRVLIGSLTGSAFVQNNIMLAFYFLLAGGILDFVLQCLPPGEPNGNTQAPPPVGGNVGKAIIAGAIILAFATSSCSVIKPEVDRTKTDTTITDYRQVDINVKGAKVAAGINIDSLVAAAKAQLEKRKADSIAYEQKLAKYRADSAAAAQAGKPLNEVKPQPPAPAPKMQYVTDPQTKAQLAYWIDQYGKFQITCEAKDQTIATLQAQVTKLTKDKTTTTKVDTQTPVWNEVVMIVEGVLLLIAFLCILFKPIL